MINICARSKVAWAGQRVFENFLRLPQSCSKPFRGAASAAESGGISSQFPLRPASAPALGVLLCRTSPAPGGTWEQALGPASDGACCRGIWHVTCLQKAGRSWPG